MQYELRASAPMDMHLVLLPLFATQHELQYFASRVLRQGTELHGGGALEVRKMLAAESDDLCFAGCTGYFLRKWSAKSREARKTDKIPLALLATARVHEVYEKAG
jgi:hypothetical protein